MAEVILDFAFVKFTLGYYIMAAVQVILDFSTHIYRIDSGLF